MIAPAIPATSGVEIATVVAVSVSALVALVALAMSIYNLVVGNRRERERDEFQKRTTEEAVETQRQLLVIEETRHRWERQERTIEEENERQAEESSKATDFLIRFGYRDSARSWARVIATSSGPAQARDVTLDVWGEIGGERHDVRTMGGHDYREADHLSPGESVHVAIVFTLASPPAEALRYCVDWTDDRGAQTKEGQVPLA
jgi:hypothetical protein